MMDSDPSGADFCRFCRSEATSDRPLFHPCICTGSIKWIHQECLVQWMRYSRKEFCELCGHRFSFMPIYSPDMPRRLPLRDVAGGLVASVAAAVKDWLHYTLVALAWLGVVPLTACRTYRSLFSGSLDPVISLPFDIISAENLAKDVFSGCFVVTCTLFSFIGLVWLREQIMHGGGPDWLERDAFPAPAQEEVANAADNNNERVAEGAADDAAPREEGAGEGGDDPLIGDEANWNPMEWDRAAAEELTWARLLGLDGSMVFLEHVFWVVSLNTLFIVVFAFCPYHIGRLGAAMGGLSAEGPFAGPLTALAGYALVGACLALLHGGAALLRLRSAKRVLGLCYVVVKVALLSVVEIGVLPLVCGWWLDLCSLSMFDATLKDREASLQAAPWTLMFIHWLVGMVYVYYFASFILLLREVLRPGVLWFLKNLNDPDFSPVQEMIHLSVWSHIHRLIASAVIFGTAVLFMLWLPIRVIKSVLPGFLPYAVAVHTEAPVSELSLELLLLQVILPALLEQSHTRTWLKAALRAWCGAAAAALGLRSYLLGERARAETQPPRAQPAPLAQQHQALMWRDGPAGYEPYTRASWFYLRVALLLVLVAISLVLASALTLLVPVAIGRRLMALWLPKSTGQVHELYTAACGMYVCWAIGRGGALAAGWARGGRRQLFRRLAQWARLALRAAAAAAALLGVVPLLFGLLLELVLVIPLRVPLEQSPVLFVWQDWALGVLYTKIVCALTMMGPDWRMRRAIEKVYRDGIRDIDLKFIISSVAAPVIRWLGLALCVPYALAHTLGPLLLATPAQRTLLARRLHPALLLLGLAAALLALQIRQFKKLYEHIKNDKYLVGQRLVNYDHRRPKPAPVAAAPANN
ncbi:E3 ubiquitin-protein ligase MARCHF6 isoform X2 [Plutella xylostella]|uniref:E3 ubiquitin-protein ligase MARCHF6 isoform X1 n=1 Tax=Plutella xylostella TaxID=51655 RepID=UPI00203249D2|nr:E3 ubiquitin-protein ligase MARCHF6 isoform X1 [Plutella xylostella]XP_048487553.1 E3 ubiquitin-protein ligase MARCHF6 isoform X2 [Plutella xylostella]